RWIPVRFSPGSHGISSVAFSRNLANRGLAFDAIDGDGDGLPDAVRFPQGRPDLVDVRYDARDRHGELDLTLANFDGVLSGGVLLEIAVEPKRRGAMWRKVRFSEAPAATFGDVLGRAVEGRAVNGRR
ncbi:MAG: hypothetical protein GY711_22840, partial [bacterium]|nr:hypothetical protein [bacterium]